MTDHRCCSSTVPRTRARVDVAHGEAPGLQMLRTRSSWLRAQRPDRRRSVARLDDVDSYADRLVPDTLDALDRPAPRSCPRPMEACSRSAERRRPNRVVRIVEYSWLMGAPMNKAFMSSACRRPGMRTVIAKMPVTRRMLKLLLRQFGIKRAIETGAFDEEMSTGCCLFRDTDTWPTTCARPPRSSPRSRLQRTRAAADGSSPD